ncbi:unnamed protein product, partial [Durusdinium trenchii]
IPNFRARCLSFFMARSRSTCSLKDAVKLLLQQPSTRQSKQGDGAGKKHPVKKQHLKQKQRFYPKTTISRADSSHALGPKTVKDVPRWARDFLRLLEYYKGASFVAARLKRVSWNMTTCFSGIGCAEVAAECIQTATNQWLVKHGRKKRMNMIELGWSCERDKHCQKVLRMTHPTRCNFDDILSVASSKTGTAFCTTHCRMCSFKSQHSLRTRVNASGPTCQAFSLMGKRQAEKDSRFSAHEAWYSHETSPHGSDIVILENVTEYRQSIVRGHFKSPLYEMQTACIDPRLFGEGSARARLYCVIYKTRKFSWDESMSLAEFLSMLKMRPQMSALSYFWQPLPKSILSKTQAENLACYKRLYPHLTVPDLDQLARTGRGRGEIKEDKSMPTLTTNTRLFSREHARYLSAVCRGH